jgi:hypothetical protein
MTAVKQLAMALLVVGSVAFAQNSTASTADFNEPEFRQVVHLRLPGPNLTQATRFVLNHSSVAVPILREAVEDDLKVGLNDSDSISRLTEMIAYAANSDAMDAVAKLCVAHEERFSPMVARVLNHAVTRKREFEVAAFAAERYPLLRSYIGEWLATNLAFPLSEEALARSVLKHEASGDRNPKDSLMPLLSERQREHFETTLESVRAIEREKAKQRQ